MPSNLNKIDTFFVDIAIPGQKDELRLFIQHTIFEYFAS
jgi:hypothetical protein